MPGVATVAETSDSHWIIEMVPVFVPALSADEDVAAAESGEGSLRVLKQLLVGQQRSTSQFSSDLFFVYFVS